MTGIPGLSRTSYHLDDDSNPPPVEQCTRDPWAYGSSGPWIDSPVPRTDPVACPQTFQILTTLRTLYYEAPGATVGDAASRASRWSTPLSITTSPWPPPSPLAVPSDALEGVPLTAVPNPADPSRIDLSWGTGCGGAVTAGYAVYEGILGSFGSHQPLDCLVPTTALTVSAAGPSHYYLVVPVSDRAEGSYGTDSTGAERSASANACLPQLAGHCP